MGANGVMLHCEECENELTPHSLGWRGALLPEGEEGPSEVVFYCPDCRQVDHDLRTVRHAYLLGLNALTVVPRAPYFSALRRVSSNADLE